MAVSPDLEILTIKCQPYYLPREFSTVIVTGVYIPPQADTTTSLQELHWTLCKLETIYLEAAFIVAGDFNKANLRTRLPKFYQHIDCITRGVIHLITATLTSAMDTKPSPYLPLANLTTMPSCSYRLIGRNSKRMHQ